MTTNIATIWIRIRRHLNAPQRITFSEGRLATIHTSSNTIYISKSTNKFRLKSHLDWAHYTPKTLAHAINNDDVDVYYERQLKDSNSTPNIWKRKDEEQELKSYYAARDGRASLI